MLPPSVIQDAALKQASCSLDTPAKVNGSLRCCCLQAAVRDEAGPLLSGTHSHLNSR